jgi:hypothetical protein
MFWDNLILKRRLRRLTPKRGYALPAVRAAALRAYAVRAFSF